MEATGFVAALPMYDFPWVAEATDAVWRALAGRLRESGLEAPETLERTRPAMEVWRDPRLLFGQTCGFPYWQSLRDRVSIVATPVFAFEGCDGPDHCSFVVSRKGGLRKRLEDFRGAVAAINGRDSNTGMNLFRAAVAPLANGAPFFGEVIVTGAHFQSLEAVAEGRADIAAVDCVSFALLAKGVPHLVERIDIVARTPATPALPYIASATLSSGHLAAIRDAVVQTLADPALAPHLASLGLVGTAVLPPEAYARVDELAKFAADLGYPELA